MSRQFDAIVIGSGLGGLTAGALYARAGHRALVIERNQNFGGAATVYRHGALAIEASLHEIDGLDPKDPKASILQSLGLDRDVPFVDVGDLHEVRSPLLGEPFVLPHGLDAALNAAKQRFPHQGSGLDGYFERICAVRHAVSTLSEHQDDRGWRLLNAPTLPWRLWPLIRDRHSTLSDVMQRLFGDDEAVKLALAPNIVYYTDDPDTMPFLSFAIPQASYLLGGGHYIRGGSQVLNDRLVAIVREAGGACEATRDASAILLEGDRVCGVRHHARDAQDSQEDIAPIVFGNAAPSVLAAMLPEEARPGFSALYNDRRPSISLWTISLGLSRRSREFGVRRYSTAIFPAWVIALADIRQAGTLFCDDPGTRIPPYSFVAYDQIDSGLNPNGPYLVSMVGVDLLANWANHDADAKRMRRERWMDRIIGDLDSHFPGIAGAVVQREMSTAETFHHYLNTPEARSTASHRRPAASCRWRRRRLTVFTWHPHSPAGAATRAPFWAGDGRRVRRWRHDRTSTGPVDTCPTNRLGRMTASGQKRRLDHAPTTSSLHRKADIQRPPACLKGANERHWCHVADCRPQNPTPIVLRPPVEVDIDDATIGFMR